MRVLWFGITLGILSACAHPHVATAPTTATGNPTNAAVAATTALYVIDGVPIAEVATPVRSAPQAYYLIDGVPETSPDR